MGRGAGGEAGAGGACESLPCDSEGETGRALQTEESGCVCETEAGYFVGADGPDAIQCDADSDGWVNDRAEAALDGNDLVLRDNAKCKLRRVAAIVLTNESGEEQSIPVDARFSKGLPLYEAHATTERTASGARSVRRDELSACRPQ